MQLKTIQIKFSLRFQPAGRINYDYYQKRTKTGKKIGKKKKIHHKGTYGSWKKGDKYHYEVSTKEKDGRPITIHHGDGKQESNGVFFVSGRYISHSACYSCKSIASLGLSGRILPIEDSARGGLRQDLPDLRQPAFTECVRIT